MKRYIGYLSVMPLVMLFIACNNNAIAPLNTGSTNQVNTPSNSNNVASTSTMDSVGLGASWLASGCSAGMTCLTNINVVTNTTVTVCFSSPPTPGVYQLVPSTPLLAPGKAILTVTNPPNQVSGSTWYSVNGTTTVVFSGTNITSLFTNITCLDSPNSSDTVFVSGQVGCL